MPNKVLVGIPTAPQLIYGEHEKAFQTSEWGLANTKWDRVWGRFSGPSTERQRAVRETWAPHIETAGGTFRFFVGHSHEGDVPADTVKLEAPDGYLDLPVKIQAMCKWALEHGFDILFKCDDDTFCHPGLVPFLQATDIEYGGCLLNYTAGGGPGYILGRKAMQALVDADMATAHPECRTWEDWLHAEIIRDAGITAVHHIGFVEEVNLMLKPEQRLTFHPVSPKGMRQMYAEFYGR